MAVKKGIGLSVVIPIFNEEKNIPGLFKKLSECEQKADFPCQFILVDGCSSDNTLIYIKEFATKKPNLDLKIVPMTNRRGYGNDIVCGLSYAIFDTMAWTHADLQTDLCDLISGYHLINVDDKNAIVKGKRMGRGLLDRLFTFGMQIYALIKLKIYLDDINAQPKIFKQEFYEKYLLSDPPKDFSLDLYLLILAKKNQYQIKTFNVFFHKRVLGEAKGGGGSWKNRINLVNRTRQYIISTSRKI